MSTFPRLIARLRAFSSLHQKLTAQSVEEKFNAWSADRRFLLSDSQR